MISAQIPSPADLGLPEKFQAWRAGQTRAIDRVLNSDKRFVVLAMPTGGGKSVVYTTACYMGGRAVVLTSTKGLQDQLIEDFNSLGLVDVRGMGNYPCQALADQREGRSPAMCDEGPCMAGNPCDFLEGGCDYFDAQRAARRADLAVTNYAYWLGINKASDQSEDKKNPLGTRTRLVLDEAHDAFEELAGHLAIEIGLWEASDVLGLTFPPGSPDMLGWKDWATPALAKCTRTLEEMQSRMKLGALKRKDMSRHRELRDLSRRLSSLITTKGEWVYEESRDRYGRRVVRFDPVWPGDYAESDLFRGINRVVLTSATVRPKTLDLLGIPRESVEFEEYNATFPVRNRPVIWTPTTRIRHDTEPGAYRLWAAKVSAIVRGRPHAKGIIHTVSYRLAKYLLEFGDFGGTRVCHHPSGGMRQAVEEFRRARAPAVLISPSVATGFDFPGDQCRYQIIGKVPFPDSRSKVMQARAARDPEYFAYCAAQQLVQMCGRGVRSETDTCQTFIVDDNVQWFVRKYRQFFPKWWLAAYSTSNSIPPPLD
jgi:Rad3-related DNA helicase